MTPEEKIGKIGQTVKQYSREDEFTFAKAFSGATCQILTDGEFALCLSAAKLAVTLTNGRKN